MKQILMMLALAVLVGCEKASTPENTDGKTNIDRALETMQEKVPAPPPIVREAEFDVVTRYYDTELQVTCYVTGAYRGGISCIPRSQLGIGAR